MIVGYQRTELPNALGPGADAGEEYGEFGHLLFVAEYGGRGWLRESVHRARLGPNFCRSRTWPFQSPRRPDSGKMSAGFNLGQRCRNNCKRKPMPLPVLPEALFPTIFQEICEQEGANSES